MEYGLIGAKLGHSFSREIHASIADYHYELCELSPEGVDALLKNRDFRAINVTIPYKETVIPYLDFVSESARKIGAVNTIVNRNGKLFGDNTDYAGAAALIRHAGVSIAGKKTLILGTGGTSKTLRAVIGDMNAREIVIVSRRPNGSEVSYADAAESHSDAEVIVNTTPVGMYPKNGDCPVDLRAFPNLEGAIDVVYNPLRTNLILQAQARGLPAEGGLYMLAAQAVYASALFTGREVDEALIEKAYRGVLEQKRNIALIGMPSCGKTTVGRIISEMTGRRLLDTDEMIVRRVNRSIPEIFEQSGEAAFRALERDAVAEAAKQSGVIIATGGGAAIDPRNVQMLRQNGELCFLDRPLEKLCVTPDRPLSKSAVSLKKRFEERYPIYCSACDFHIAVSGKPEDAARQVLNAIGEKI